eukprot:TRINITY_DN1915_c0_g1_i2.p1 TRINITY_DN1915_c0_g1~~TRINITY_DN1915_c0_g1_i2.p1  ORF type:complete len:380 (-),score=128.47 TRINITY_DN1915_c0_g1_i2:265-1305(-)
MMKTKRELERERQQQQQQQQETAAIAIAGFGMAAGSASEAGGYQDNWRPAMRERPLPFDVDSEARMAEQQAAAAAGARAAADDGGMDDLDDDDDDDGDDSAQAGGSKPRRARAAAKRCGKGLRHFSSKVSDQVQSRGTTTYIEVANHLVQEFHAAKVEEAADAAAIGADVPAPMNSVYEEKNIRRRVYDALNVLLALNIITRERKAIRWVGVPTDFAQTAARLERELDEKRAEVKRKREELSECVSHLIAVRRCRMAMEANSAAAAAGADGGGGGTADGYDETQLKLPFITVATHRDTVVKCEMVEGQQEVSFEFSRQFRCILWWQHCSPHRQCAYRSWPFEVPPS